MASEYLKWKYQDVRPDAPPQRTKKQRAANWWHYHKWWLLAGAALLIAAGDILWNALGIGAVKPDYQLAYVASAPLSDETLAALERAFAALGEDCNGDGRVVFRVNSYVRMDTAQDSDAAQYTAAAKVRLMADMEACESYFFICDAPETLHENYDILANASGDIAGPDEALGCFAWETCPKLMALAVDQQEMTGLYFARRGFWQDRTCGHREQCDALWERLTEGAE